MWGEVLLTDVRLRFTDVVRRPSDVRLISTDVGRSPTDVLPNEVLLMSYRTKSY